jgi:hemerythrin-like domain-containing protein
MLMDHDAGRAHVGVLAAHAEQAPAWTSQDRTAIAAAAQGYADLLRGHIRKEDQILYPMARMRLHEEQLARVDQECASFEERQVAAGADSLKDLGRELVARHRAAP